MIGIICAMQEELKEIKDGMEPDGELNYSGVDFYLGKLEGQEVVCAVSDMVIARQLVQHDMDVTALGVPRGQILGSDIRYIPTSDDIRDELFSSIMLLNAEKAFGDREVKALQGTIASGDQFISSKGKKQLIVEEFEAIACEMEGAAIAQVCYVNKLPFCVLRAISDSADAGAKMDYPAFVELAASNSAKVIKRFLKNRS